MSNKNLSQEKYTSIRAELYQLVEPSYLLHKDKKPEINKWDKFETKF